MVQQHADWNLLFTIRGELRPIACNRFVDVQQLALDEHRGTDRGSALRRRKHDHRRIFLPASAVLPLVGDAAPEINHLATFHVQAERPTYLTAFVEVRFERIVYALESLRHRAMYRHHTLLSSTRLRRCPTPRLPSFAHDANTDQILSSPLTRSSQG